MAAGEESGQTLHRQPPEGEFGRCPLQNSERGVAMGGTNHLLLNRVCKGVLDSAGNSFSQPPGRIMANPGDC